MTARDRILAKLRAARRPFPHALPVEQHLPVAPVDDTGRSALAARFVREAESLACHVYSARDAQDAIGTVLQIIDRERRVSAWDWDHIPLPGLEQALAAIPVEIAPPGDASVRVGITGAAAALAATGSLVLDRRRGCPGSPSLLPPVHVAVITEDQILPHFEAWIAQQRLDGLDGFRGVGNVVVVSGPSRTADIAMELILGMHGPQELHIIITDQSP